MEQNAVSAIDYLQSQDIQWIEQVAYKVDCKQQYEVLLCYLTMLTNNGVIDESCHQYKDLLQSKLSAGIKSMFDTVNKLVLADRILVYSNYEYLNTCYENLTGHKLYEDK